MSLTPEAKKLLAETIRGTAQAPEKGLRGLLIRAIHDEADRRYRLSIPIADAGLDRVHEARRRRIETWLDEHARAATEEPTTELDATKMRLFAQAEKEAAATLLCRLVLLRHLEALGLSKPMVLTGGWNSKGYREFREFSPALANDDSEGYAFLLELVFDELAIAMPGLFGYGGLAPLLPVPASTLRAVVERLDEPRLASAWGDDTTLGWVYQYWNDPERREIDARLDAQSKLASADVAAKTQVFTERYMVEWLLQNSLGFTWLCICQQHGWVPEARTALSVLATRRADWAGSDVLGAPPPGPNELEKQWQYYVQRPLPPAAVEQAPESVRALRILDPACGSGHFLVIAFDLLAALYREEARHRGEALSEREIAESIVEHNLHGIDLDRRAVQLAAAGLYLKARTLDKNARPRRLNLVAPKFLLGNAWRDVPAVLRLRRDLKRELRIPEAATDQLLENLASVSYLGSLLKVEVLLEDAIGCAEPASARPPAQGLLFEAQSPRTSEAAMKASALACLVEFLAAEAASDDLGLQLGGEQLAAGARFLRLTCPGSYDLVVGNPPYFGTQALAETDYLDRVYPLSKENLCTAMLDRALELARGSGQVAFVAIRHWLYVSQLSAFRTHVFRNFPPTCVADLGLGGFESLPGVEVAMVIAQRGSAECLVTDARDGGPVEKAVALATVAECFRTDPAQLARIPGSPFVYRWSQKTILDYLETPLLGDVAKVRVGMKTSDNLRFLRCPWELAEAHVRHALSGQAQRTWVPYVKGAAGKVWIEPLADLINWREGGLEVRLALAAAYGQGPQGEEQFFQRGVAFSTIGRAFIARAHRYPSLCDVAGSSVFPPDVAAAVCLLNSRFAREVAQDLNPTINFQVGDVARIPYRVDPRAGEIFRVLEDTFARHETTDELSPNFSAPGPSVWRYAQAWAKSAVDSAPSTALPAYEPVPEAASSFAQLSFALGVVLGRFDAAGGGFRDEPKVGAVPSGILFLSASGLPDGLGQKAAAHLNATWTEWTECTYLGAREDDLRGYLRKSFFDAHKKMYENRPIYWPLSSSKKNFVAIVSIHRWHDDTLNLVLAEYLLPEKRRLEGELSDLVTLRASGMAGARRGEKRLSEVQRFLDELNEFIAKVSEVAHRGPPRAANGIHEREVDARFALDLNDGVLVNSAALWPLLDPQWKDPKKWWTQLADKHGPKGAHFEWSHTAARYFPSRVREQCRRSPVLAAAHLSLWRDHPEIAYEWELRLEPGGQVQAGFGEPDAELCRSRFLAQHSGLARGLEAAALKRRERRAR